MTIPVDLSSIENTNIRRKLTTALMGFTGSVRVVTDPTTAQFQAALDAGPGKVVLNGTLSHDQTALADAIKMRDDVAVVKGDGGGVVRPGLPDTVTLVDAQNAKHALWAADMDGNGVGGMADGGRGLLFESGCRVMACAMDNFLGTTVRPLVMTRDGDFDIDGVTFDGNEYSVDGSALLKGGSARVCGCEFTNTRSRDIRFSLSNVESNGMVVNLQGNIHNPPIATSWFFTAAFMLSQDIEQYRYGVGSSEIGSLYLGNGLAHSNARDASQTAPNGTTDASIWHAVDGLKRSHIVGVDNGEAFLSNAYRSYDTVNEDCMSVNQDTGIAIGAGIPGGGTPLYTREQFVSKRQTFRRVFMFHPSLDRDDDHAGSSPDFTGTVGGRAGFIANTVDDLTIEDCGAFGDLEANGGKMKFGAAGDEMGGTTTVTGFVSTGSLNTPDTRFFDA